MSTAMMHDNINMHSASSSSSSSSSVRLLLTLLGIIGTRLQSIPPRCRVRTPHYYHTNINNTSATNAHRRHRHQQRRDIALSSSRDGAINKHTSRQRLRRCNHAFESDFIHLYSKWCNVDDVCLLHFNHEDCLMSSHCNDEIRRDSPSPVIITPHQLPPRASAIFLRDVGYYEG